MNGFVSESSSFWSEAPGIFCRDVYTLPVAVEGRVGCSQEARRRESFCPSPLGPPHTTLPAPPRQDARGACNQREAPAPRPLHGWHGNHQPRPRRMGPDGTNQRQGHRPGERTSPRTPLGLALEAQVSVSQDPADPFLHAVMPLLVGKQTGLGAGRTREACQGEPEPPSGAPSMCASSRREPRFRRAGGPQHPEELSLKQE